MRRKITIGIVVIVVLLGIWFLFLKPKGGQQDMATVERGSVTEDLILSGGIQAREYAAMVFPVSGELASVSVQEGENVAKGKELARLNTTNLWAAVQQAEASLRSAEASLNNVYDQIQGHESDESYAQIETRTTAEAAKDGAYFALIQARENLSNSVLKAPFNGVVTNVANTTPGITVIAAQSQIEIINPETIYFIVYADQTEVNAIREGQKVNVVLDAYLNEILEGTVTRVSYTPATNEVGIVYPVEISLNKTSLEGQLFRVGMTGDATFILNSADDVLHVPPAFIKNDESGDYVTTKDGSKVYVETGVEGPDRVEIKGDIQEGLQIYD